MKESILCKTSFDFALMIVQYCKFIMNNQKEYILTKQLVRSGTSIGANIREAQYASSRADFTAKMHIALKECNETDYWLSLLHSAGYGNENHNILINKNIELRKMLTATINTTKKNNSVKK